MWLFKRHKHNWETVVEISEDVCVGVSTNTILLVLDDHVFLIATKACTQCKKIEFTHRYAAPRATAHKHMGLIQQHYADRDRAANNK